MKECCKTCAFCRCIKTSLISIGFVCQKKGSVIEDIEIKCCDAMYEPYKVDKENKE